jgi:uncharacterized protein (UPF0335 family)
VQYWLSVSQALERIRQAARGNGKEKFTALLHHIRVDLLETAFLESKKDAATGIDGATWRDYEADLERKLADLHARVQSGGDAEPAGLHPQAGRRATPAGGGGAGGQDRPTRRGQRAERCLRGGFPRLQLWLSAGTSEVAGVPGDRICSFIERIERMDEEIRALNDRKKGVFSEAKGEGFDVKVLKEIVRLRKQDKDERDE